MKTERWGLCSACSCPIHNADDVFVKGEVICLECLDNRTEEVEGNSLIKASWLGGRIARAIDLGNN